VDSPLAGAGDGAATKLERLTVRRFRSLSEPVTLEFHLAERFPTRRCQELGLSYAAFVADLETAIQAS
jgi:hypothetical protein